jgi:hypothetical protein
VIDSAPIHIGGPTEEALFAWRSGRLHPEAADWIGAHLDGCSRCRSAVEHIDAVHVALEPPPEPPFLRQRQITEVRRRLEERPTRRVPWKQMKWAALCGAVAGFALVFALHPRHSLPPRDGVGFALVSRQGAADVEVGDDHAVAEAKMALPAGGWLTVAPSSRVVATWAGARVAVEGGPTGARVQLAESRALLRTLKLERGRVVLDVDPLAPGAVLAVQTGDSRVTVHGTRFLVEATPGGTSVAVDRGRVRVIGGRTLDVAAGLQIIPGAAQPMALGADFAARLAALDAPLASGPTESLDVFADVADATVDVDGVEYGRAPLSLALMPGAHLVRVRATGRLPVEERVELTAGTPMLFHAELPELSSVEEPESQPHAAATTTVPARVGAAELLSRARADVLAGAYDRAIGRLHDLAHGSATKLQLERAALLEAQAERLARRPERALPLFESAARGNGPEAEQAQFLLAQTLGRDLHDPVRAAAAYEASERRFARGIFAEEAALRRGEALLAAGSSLAGVEALERYLRQYPTAPHADEAHLSIASARRDRLGDCAGAVPHLRAVADGRGPRAELALIGEARCLRTLGRSDDARGVYEKYLRVQPHGRYADEARLGATGSAKLIP